MTSSAACNVLQELDNIIECPVCRDTLSDPRTLPCIHTYCLKCIAEFSKAKLPGQRASCPVCRAEFAIPDKGVDGLPKNFFIQQLKDIAVIPAGHCEGCAAAAEAGPEEQVVRFCVECRQKFCENCVHIHRRVRATSGHKLVKIGDEEATRGAAVYCDTHPDESLKLYCFDCQAAICFLCFAELHKSHECVDVNKTVDEFRKQMTLDVQKMAETVTRCRDMLNVPEQNQRKLILAIDAIEKKINEQADRLKKQVDAEKRRLLEKLEAHKKDRIKQIDHVIENIKQHMSSANGLVKYTEELRNKGSASSIAQQRHVLHDRVEELAKLDDCQRDVNDVNKLGSESGLAFEAVKIPANPNDNLIGQLVPWQNRKVVSSNAASEPTHVITDGDRGEVVGVTSIDSRLFVLRHPSQQRIEMYDTFTLQYHLLKVKNLGDNMLHSGLASCITNNCVYVSDWSGHVVCKVELSGDKKVASWSVGRGPNGLSVNNMCNLLVSCFIDKKIQEYTTSGSLVRGICLRFNPLHVLQLSSDRFVVLSPNDMVEVDSNGRLAVSYIDQLKSTAQHKFSRPRQLSVGKINEFILVADRDNNRIIIVNRSMKCSARILEVKSVDGGLQTPSCVYFNDAKNRLFVGEESGRVLVFDSVM